ncbi:MAG: hypothetical protein WCX65_03860 [bacterium]
MTDKNIEGFQGAPEDDGRLDREFVRKWLINFQHELVMKRYDSVPHGEHLRDLFVKYLYPDYAHRANYEARNELFRWAAKVYKSGKIDRLLGAANFLFHRWIEALKTEKELPFYIDAVIESYDLTCEIDEKMVDAIREMAKSEADLNMEIYKRAFNMCSTREQRYKQVENLVGAGEYAKAIIEGGGLIDFLIERLPMIPLLSRNRFVGALNEATGMIKAAYRAFKKSRGHLDDLRDTIRTLEIGFIDEMLGPPETPYTPPPFATVPNMLKK